MIDEIKNEYIPDSVSRPGETLLETLEALGMTQAELAERTGRPKKTINEIIKGKTAITPETALQLERVLGVPAGFWNKREQTYREFLAQRNEQKWIKKQSAWLKEFPLRAMINAGWVTHFKDKARQLEAMLSFFGVASPEQWRKLYQLNVAFRKSPVFQSAPASIAAWLRKGELESQKIVCNAFNSDKFRKVLPSIRKLSLTTPPTFLPKLTQLCAQAGVALVFVPELPKTHTSGATRWLTRDKALIQLSLRYKTDDHFWFTFFHEAAHILLHGKKTVFIEDNTKSDLLEKAADKFASVTLISPPDYKSFLKKGDKSRPAIKRFAGSQGIAPGIVVGRLQHDGYFPHSYGNDLKQKFVWN